MRRNGRRYAAHQDVRMDQSQPAIESRDTPLELPRRAPLKGPKGGIYLPGPEWTENQLKEQETARRWRLEAQLAAENERRCREGA